MFKLNDKEYDQSKLSDKGKAAYSKLIRVAEQKAGTRATQPAWHDQQHQAAWSGHDAQPVVAIGGSGRGSTKERSSP